MKTPLRVLVVDDDQEVLRSLGDYLEDEGHRVFRTRNGEEALEMVRKEALDAAIVDMRLPELTGDAMILALHRRQPLMKFVVYTGSHAYRLSEELEEIGMDTDSVFRKPVADMGVLAKAIERIARAT